MWGLQNFKVTQFPIPSLRSRYCSKLCTLFPAPADVTLHGELFQSTARDTLLLLFLSFRTARLNVQYSMFLLLLSLKTTATTDTTTATATAVQDYYFRKNNLCFRVLSCLPIDRDYTKSFIFPC